MHRGRQRLRYLDGLRGVAIALVLVWHLFGPNDARYLAYGDRYGMLPVIRHGWMGVEIFFLISGFVIFMTIERCTGIVDFLLRRWVRLFPAMLVASILLFAIDRLAHLPGPTADTNPIDLLPGLSFVPPALWHLVLRLPIRQIDEVFWTLYVEAAFYLIFSVCYFRLGWQRAVAILLGLFLFTRAMRLGLPLLHAPPTLSRAIDPFEWIGCQYFGWFASGALFYRWIADRRAIHAASAIAIGLLAGLLFDFPTTLSLELRILLAVILLSFAAVHRLPPLQRLLALPPALFVGDISYPLYLVHNNLGIGLTAAFARLLPGASPVWWGLLSMVAVGLLAWAIARIAEPLLTPYARRLTDAVRARLAERRSYVRKPISRSG